MSPPERVRAVTVGLLSALAIGLSGCGQKEADLDPVAIRIGDREIRLSELQSQIDYSVERGNLFPGGEAQFIDQFVERQVLLERAISQGLQDDIEIQRQWENLLIGRFKQNELQAQLALISVSEEEVSAYYEDNLSVYTKPSQVRIALLFLENSSKMSAEQVDALREQLKEARLKAQELPEDSRGFGALAMRYSEEATSRFKGGDIGWLQEGRDRYRWPQTVVDTAFSLSENGELSPVLETDEGYYLLMRLDGRDAIVQPLEDQLFSSLRNKILKLKRADLTARLKNEWVTSVDVVSQPEVIATLNFPNQNDSKVAPQELTRLP